MVPLTLRPDRRQAARRSGQLGLSTALAPRLIGLFRLCSGRGPTYCPSLHLPSSPVTQPKTASPAVKAGSRGSRRIRS